MPVWIFKPKFKILYFTQCIPPTGLSKLLSFYRYVPICTNIHIEYCYLVLLRDSPPLLLWKLLFSEFHVRYIKRFWGKKRQGKKHQDSEKSSTLQEEERRWLCDLFCWYTMLWAGHYGHPAGLWAFAVWPAPRWGHVACIISPLQALSLWQVNDHICSASASPLLPYKTRVYQIKAHSFDQIWSLAPKGPRHKRAGWCCVLNAEELSALCLETQQGAANTGSLQPHGDLNSQSSCLSYIQWIIQVRHFDYDFT